MEFGILERTYRQNDVNAGQIKNAERSDMAFSDCIKPPGRDMEVGKAPYDHLAEDGVITYEGVVFRLDTKQNQLHLGDTTDKSKCLVIGLSGGGHLVVNKDNLEQLSGVIDMFCAKDQFLIMNALMMEKKIKEVKGEIEESDSIMIGANSYTQKEWNQVVERFDEAEEHLRQETEEAKDEAEEKGVSESDIHVAYERMKKWRRDKA